MSKHIPIFEDYDVAVLMMSLPVSRKEFVSPNLYLTYEPKVVVVEGKPTYLDNTDLYMATFLNKDRRSLKVVFVSDMLTSLLKQGKTPNLEFLEASLKLVLFEESCWSYYCFNSSKHMYFSDTLFYHKNITPFIKYEVTLQSVETDCFIRALDIDTGESLQDVTDGLIGTTIKWQAGIFKEP